jgi:hypothetical protein
MTPLERDYRQLLLDSGLPLPKRPSLQHAREIMRKRAQGGSPSNREFMMEMLEVLESAVANVPGFSEKLRANDNCGLSANSERVTLGLRHGDWPGFTPSRAG